MANSLQFFEGMPFQASHLWPAHPLQMSLCGKISTNRVALVQGCCARYGIGAHWGRGLQLKASNSTQHPGLTISWRVPLILNTVLTPNRIFNWCSDWLNTFYAVSLPSMTWESFPFLESLRYSFMGKHGFYSKMSFDVWKPDFWGSHAVPTTLPSIRFIQKEASRSLGVMELLAGACFKGVSCLYFGGKPWVLPSHVGPCSESCAFSYSYALMIHIILDKFKVSLTIRRGNWCDLPLDFCSPVIFIVTNAW